MPTVSGPNGVLWDVAQRWGVLPVVRRARAALRREEAHWIAAGCPSPAPTVVKLAVVRRYVESSGYGRFVETGTYLGGTVEVIARLGVRCQTIEYDAALHSRAQRLFRRRPNVECLFGDSAVIIPTLLDQLDQPAVFWLDGHFSGGVTGSSTDETPIGAELDAILDHHVDRHVILIDDAREFDGTGDYPHLSAVLDRVERDPRYEISVSADIIRIVPTRS